jgi:hypothetical protein
MWIAITFLFLLQAFGNMFYVFDNINQELMNKLLEFLSIDNSVYGKRLISIALGIVYPLTSLAFIKTFINYYEKK